MSGQKEAALGFLVVELVLVVDYTIYKRNEGDMRKIVKRVLDIANSIKEVNKDTIVLTYAGFDITRQTIEFV